MSRLRITSLIVANVLLLATACTKNADQWGNHRTESSLPSVVDSSTAAQSSVKTDAGEDLHMVSLLDDMEILLRIDGSFLGSGRASELVLLTDPTRRYGNLHDDIDLDRTLCIDAASGTEYDVGHWSFFVYEDRYLRQVRAPEAQLGPWNGYCYITDTNRNGIDEIVGFQLSGSSFLPVIFEFDGTEFVPLLDFTTYAMAFAHIEFRENRQIYIVGYGDTRIVGRDYDWYLYEWSDQSNRYEIIDEGMVDPSQVPSYD